MSLLVKFILILQCLFVVADPCPKKCSCHSSWIRGVTSVVVDCSKRGFTSIPTKRVSRYITSFVLNENYITELPKNAFKKYRYLRELYLYKNFLTSIDKDAFAGLRKLTELSLHSNRLKKIENGTFSHLRRLRRLYIFSNFIEEINSGTFAGLTNVETVFLHENLLRFIPKDTFVPLERLRVLTLYRNYLRTLFSGSFNGLSAASQLFIHQNKISHIEPGAFQACKVLIKLQLGNNHLANITKEMFLGLDRLLELYLDSNRITEIKLGTFDHTRQVRKLVLLSNRIVNLKLGVFSNLTDLFVLSLSGNRLTRLRPGIFIGLISLTQLFLQDNKIEEIEPLTFEGMISLQQLYLFRNLLYYIRSKTFYGMFTLSELNLGVNKISGLANGAFLGLPRLLILQLNSNQISFISVNAFQKLRNLYRLVIYFNRISFIADNAFSDLKRLASIVWYPPLALVRTAKKLGSIQSNNLHCDCNLKWLKGWLLSRRMKSAMFCEKPTYLKGWNVTAVHNDDFKCTNIRITVKPQNILVLPSSKVYINCYINSLADYSWIKNGTVLSSSNTVTQMTTGMLTLTNVSSKDSGQYTCIAKTKTGVLAASTLLTIGEAPKLTSKEEFIIVTKPKEAVVLKCQSKGSPLPLHVWYHNGFAVIDGAHNKFIGYDGRLIITKFNQNDAGIYRCSVQNELGTDSKIISVRFDKEFSSCKGGCNNGFTCIETYTCRCSENSTSSQCQNNTLHRQTDSQTDSGSGKIDDTDNEDGDDNGDETEGQGKLVSLSTVSTHPPSIAVKHPLAGAMIGT